MALVATEHDPSARKTGHSRIPASMGWWVSQCSPWFTITRASDTVAVLARLGAGAPALILVFLLFATALAMLKFP